MMRRGWEVDISRGFAVKKCDNKDTTTADCLLALGTRGSAQGLYHNELREISM